MPNKHIKVINGRRYYYESIRKGKKVVSRYLGPVDERKRKPKKMLTEEHPQEVKQEEQAEQTYIG